MINTFNVKEELRRDIKSGNIRRLKILLESELEITKENLIDRPIEQAEKLRGEAIVLRKLINLLG